MNRLGELADDRLSHWCRQQRNAPERVDLAELEAELMTAALEAGGLS